MKNNFYSLITCLIVLLSGCVSDLDVDVVDHRARCGNGLLEVAGSGPIITETLSLNNITKVTNLQGVDVRISQGSQQVVTATGHANVIRRLETRVSSGGWTIALEEGCYPNLTLTIDITLPEIEEVTSKSSGNIFLEGFDGIENLAITSWGSGDIRAISDFATLQELKLDSRGSGNLSLYQVPADNCVVYSAGSGQCSVMALNSLDVTIKGSGDINYQGSPVITQQLIGSGRVVDAN